jgi:hypothetical protein
VGGQQQGQGGMGVAHAAIARPEKGFAHRAIGVGCHIGVREPGDPVEGGHGPQGPPLAGAVERVADGQHGRGLGKGLGQQGVLPGVGLWLAEQQIEQDGLGLGRGNSVKGFRMDRTPPGPAADRLQAGFVDGHDQNVVVGGPRPGRQARVVDGLVEAPGPAAPGRQRGQQGHDKGQCPSRLTGALSGAA